MDARTAVAPGVAPAWDRAAFRVVLLSSLGGALEFYDFVAYGFFSAYISRAFFPAADPLVSLLGTYAVLAIGYLARPVGGLIFGRRGDMAGRRGSFMLSLGLMSAATVAMGLVPSYATGGAWATVAFVALRLVQGFCVGGELPGAITYAVEVVPVRRATLACGIVFGCVSAGVLLAAGVSAGLHAALDEPAMQAFGWRIAFAIGGLLGGIGWLLRRSLDESPAFLRMRARIDAQGKTPRPIATLFRDHGGRIVVGILATGIVGMFNGLLFAHMGGYLVRGLGVAPPAVATAINLSVVVTSVALIAGAALGDVLPRRRVFQAGCLLIAAGAMPAYDALVSRSLDLNTIFVLIGLSTCFTHGIFAAILADLFPTEVRFSGVACSINIGAAIFSGVAPLAATLLVERTGWRDAPGLLVVASALIALAATVPLRHYEGELRRADQGGTR